jgi:hypothetical protein
MKRRQESRSSQTYGRMIFFVRAVSMHFVLTLYVHEHVRELGRQAHASSSAFRETLEVHCRLRVRQSQ